MIYWERQVKVDRQSRYNMVRVTFHRSRYWILCKEEGCGSGLGVREASVELVTMSLRSPEGE